MENLRNNKHSVPAITSEANGAINNSPLSLPCNAEAPRAPVPSFLISRNFSGDGCEAVHADISKVTSVVPSLFLRRRGGT